MKKVLVLCLVITFPLYAAEQEQPPSSLLTVAELSSDFLEGMMTDVSQFFTHLKTAFTDEVDEPVSEQYTANDSTTESENQSSEDDRIPASLRCTFPQVGLMHLIRRVSLSRVEQDDLGVSGDLSDAQDDDQSTNQGSSAPTTPDQTKLYISLDGLSDDEVRQVWAHYDHVINKKNKVG